MKNFKIVFVFDGCSFYDIVEAETAEQAFEYFQWITNEKYGNIKTEETSEIATYYCPVGWTKPESREQAQWRSLSCYLKANGLDIYNNDELRDNMDKLDKLMSDLMYTKKIDNRELLNGTRKFAVYEKSGRATLDVEL